MKRERDLVAEFKEKLAEYNQLDGSRSSPADHIQRRQDLREWINRHIPIVTTYANSVGISTSIYYSPAPAVGGLRGDIDLLANVFFLDRYRIAPVMVYDMLDRTIGQYDFLISQRWKRRLNPLHWVGQLIRLPFRFLDFAGFSGATAERGIIGKLYKLVAAAGATLLVILELYSHLKPILNANFGLALP